MTTNYQEGVASSSTAGGAGDSTDAKQRAQQVAGSAAQEGQHVAGVAQEHAKKVTGEAKDQLRGLVDDATSQLEDQSRTQKSKLAETLRGFGEDLGKMSSKGAADEDGAGGSQGGPAQQLVQQAADQATSLAQRLEDREPRELLDDVRRFARQKPGTFILGALVAGVVAGRLTRGAKAARDDEGSPSGGAASSPELRAPVTTTPPPIPAPSAADGPDVSVLAVRDGGSAPEIGGAR